ncbi:hypothetical protein TL16_g02547 [Triparma laevis f. inornata]|uniref:Phospholipid/glycerol acyltransferase domain-containing protein n=1 Tax=Triparma laevis f. inornata TaxID=1714386 RepID=A0A9W6ZWD3_9STRA|nr:hypothetical protein TL16_g02547 [Triparma laevis f. inornata]
MVPFLGASIMSWDIHGPVITIMAPSIESPNRRSPRLAKKEQSTPTTSKSRPNPPQSHSVASAAGAAAAKGGTFDSTGRKPLVGENVGFVKTALVMTYSHLCVTLLCVNVIFDLVIYGLPAYIFLLPLSKSLFRKYMTGLINYTTPIVFNLPMILSGTKLHCDSMDYYENKVKAANSLMLANHGSRIDWMIGMYVGYIEKPVRVRVGFVCEKVIKYMPFIGWYRNVICEDVFVDRSFKIDKINISTNLNSFHDSNTERMLYLSPEGVVVDFGERDMQYMQNCRDFCVEYGMEPFDYVLTPRYKGQTILVEHIAKAGTITSICTAFVRDGKLLNCEMWSKERVVADIYSLCAGLGGSPVDIYINLEEMHFTADSDIKTIMMMDYQRKDKLLREWHTMLKEGRLEEFKARFPPFVPHFWFVQVIQTLHGLQFYALTSFLGIWEPSVKFLFGFFLFISISHTFGWLMNGTSMESVPFETGIKAVLMRLFAKFAKHKEDKRRAREGSKQD